MPREAEFMWIVTIGEIAWAEAVAHEMDGGVFGGGEVGPAAALEILVRHPLAGRLKRGG